MNNMHRVVPHAFELSARRTSVGVVHIIVYPEYCSIVSRPARPIATSAGRHSWGGLAADAADNYERKLGAFDIDVRDIYKADLRSHPLTHRGATKTKFTLPDTGFCGYSQHYTMRVSGAHSFARAAYHSAMNSSSVQS